MSQTTALLNLISEFPEPFQDPELPSSPAPKASQPLPVVPVAPALAQAKSVGLACVEAIAAIESRNPALLKAIVPLPKVLVELNLDETYSREYDPTCPGGMCPITGNS